MKHERLRERLRDDPIPGGRDSEQRAWEVVRAAYEERMPVARPPHRRRIVLALAGATVLLALLLSPAGAQVRDWVEDVIEPEKERVAPALNRLPAPGHLLVRSAQGPWIVNEDGGARLLGSYDQATWSPTGMFVGVAEGGQLTAVVGPAASEDTGEPVGTVRWSKSYTRPVRDLSWAPTGYRVAYVTGDDLRVIVGDGSEPTIVAKDVAEVAAAWKPLTASEWETLPKTGGIGAHVLAYVDGDGRVRVVDTDSRQERWRSGPFDSTIEAIGWTPRGEALFVLTETELTLLDGSTGATDDVHGFAPATAVAAAASPRTGQIATVVQRVRPGGEVNSKLLLLPGKGQRVPYGNPGRFTDVAWSPNGRWLLVAWEDADQWLFINPRTGRPDAVGNISEQFAPGEVEAPPFPQISGWCCAPPPGAPEAPRG
jgi:hypothetical protein